MNRFDSDILPHLVTLCGRLVESYSDCRSHHPPRTHNPHHFSQLLQFHPRSRHYLTHPPLPRPSSDSLPPPKPLHTPTSSPSPDRPSSPRARRTSSALQSGEIHSAVIIIIRPSHCARPGKYQAAKNSYNEQIMHEDIEKDTRQSA